MLALKSYQIFFVYLRVIGVISMSNLKYFETFSYIGVSTRVKRFSGTKELYTQVKFKAFKRNFVLVLKSGTDVLAEGFSAQLVGPDGQMSSFHVDQNIFFSGHLLEDPEVRVAGHMEDALFSIQIFDYNVTYSIEPAVNVLHPSNNPDNHTHVAYRSCDITHRPQKCVAGLCNQQLNVEPVLTMGDFKKRFRRKVSHDICVIYLVADNDFFTHRCRRHFLHCSSLMINFIQNVDVIFRNSVFVDSSGKTYKGVGIQIGMLVLYTAYTYTAELSVNHFNAKGINWNHQSKLDSFSYFMGYLRKKFCLCHLLTSYVMPGHVFGNSFLGEICAVKNGSNSSKNTGFTSDMDEGMNLVLSQHLNLLIAHGHSFGSPHDPDTSECAPTESNGGWYLMWSRKSTIDHPNNKFFSPCSLGSIGETLRTKSQCFVSKHKLIPLCGNGIVERGEECDAGAIGIVNGDMCCSKFCRFIDGADCSDLNTECCANCRLASHRTVCHDYGGADCKMRTYCTGRSFHCPLPMDVDNFVPCLDGRLCYEGDCLNFCEIYSIERNLTLEPCLCQSSDKDACKWCCYDNSDPKHPGECEPYSDQTLRDGRPCYYGFCENGMCVKADNSSDYFTETFLKKALRGGLSEFVKRNIVLVVSVMNLIFFLPMAWFICVWDMRLKMHRNSMKERGVQTVPQIQKKNTFLPRGIAALKSKFINKGPKAKQNFIIPTIVIIPPDDGSLPEDVTTYSTRMAYENNNPDWSAESKTNYEESCILPEEARPADQPEKTSFSSAEKTISAESEESSNGTFNSIDSYMKSFVKQKVSIESWKTATLDDSKTLFSRVTAQESLQSDATKRDHSSFKPQTSRVTFKNDNSEKKRRESNTGVPNETAV